MSGEGAAVVGSPLIVFGFEPAEGVFRCEPDGFKAIL